MGRVEVGDEVVAFPGLRQHIPANTELQGQARGYVPVVHCIEGGGEVDIVADRLPILLRIAFGQSEQAVHDAVTDNALFRSRILRGPSGGWRLAFGKILVTGELVSKRVASKVVLSIGGAKELLVLAIPVVAEAEFESVFAHGVRDIDLGLDVLCGVVPRSRTHLLAGSIVAEAAEVGNFGGSAIVEEVAGGPTRGRIRLRVVIDVDLVAVVVYAAFNKQVG